MKGLDLGFIVCCCLPMFASSFITTFPKQVQFLKSFRTKNCIGVKVVLFSSKNENNRRKSIKKSTLTSQRKTGKSTSQRRGLIKPSLKFRTNQNVKQQTKLLEPSIVFSNNHLLLVNKPPGYHSQPNESPALGNNSKCMLSKLKSLQLGGGSSKDFLLPMHRLDQVGHFNLFDMHVVLIKLIMAHIRLAIFTFIY